MTLSAIYCLVSKLGIPKKKKGAKVYYSKTANGTDIYTVSKMLTKKNMATTQIYAEIVRQK